MHNHIKSKRKVFSSSTPLHSIGIAPTGDSGAAIRNAVLYTDNSDEMRFAKYTGSVGKKRELVGMRERSHLRVAVGWISAIGSWRCAGKVCTENR